MLVAKANSTSKNVFRTCMCHSDRQATALHAEGKLSVKDTVAEKEEDPRMSRAHKKQRFTQKQLHQERRQQKRQCRNHQQLHWKKRQKAAAPLDTPVSTAMLRPQDKHTRQRVHSAPVFQRTHALRSRNCTMSFLFCRTCQFTSDKKVHRTQ